MRSRNWLTGGIPIWACALAIGLPGPQARAEDLGNRLYDRFQVVGSGAMLWLGSNVRIDSEDGRIGTDLDAEEDLGLSRNRFQPRLEVRWRPGHRHELELGYQFARRDNSRQLGRTIEVGDTSFTAGADIRSTFDSDNMFLTYRFAIMARERTQLGAAVGLGAFFFKVGVDALAGVAVGGKSDSVTYSNTTSFVGPTAALGAFGRFRVANRWYLEPDVRYLRVTIDRFTARVVEAGLAGRFFISRRVGVEGGIGVRGVRVDIGPKTDGGGIVDLKVSARVKYTESQLRLGVVVPL